MLASLEEYWSPQQSVCHHESESCTGQMNAAISKYAVLYSCSLLLLALLARSAMALDPTQPTTNYIRTTFTVEDGLPNNVVNAILQSRDGILWIGTDAGLVRFNGREFTPVDFRMAGSASHVARALAETPDGSLWVGMNLGIVRIPDVEHYEPGRSTSQLYHMDDAKDERLVYVKLTRRGDLWVGTTRGLYHLEGASFVCVLPEISVQAISEASNGHLLIVANNDFLEWDHGRIIKHPALAASLAPEFGITAHERVDDVFHHVMEDHTGAMWFSTHWGIVRQNRDTIYRYLPYGGKHPRNEMTTYEDGQGTVWVVRDAGVFRAQTDSLQPLLRGVMPRAILADRDGNLWIGTNGDGLIRFRDRRVHIFTTADGLPNNVPMTVLERHDGSIWVGNNCGGLSRFDGMRFVTYSEKDGLLNSCVWALAEDANEDLWLGTWGGGAFRFKHGRFEQYSRQRGLRSDVVRSIVAGPDGSQWFATDDGLTHMYNGHLRNYSTADGLTSNHLIAVYASRRGEILVASSLGIDRMIGDRFMPLSSPRQILDPRYIGFGETRSGELYAFSAPQGISRIESNRLVEIGPHLDLLKMAEFRGRELWFSGGNGIFRFPMTSAGFSSAYRGDPLDYAKFGRADGLNSTQCSIGQPNMFVDREGRLWVATVQGLAMIHLLRLPHQRRRPAIFIDEVTVDRQTQRLPSQTVISPGNHRLELKFDAIELTSPEKIRFQYRLDGVEGAWLDAGPARTAIYTGVPIGTHWFHVRACNSDGVWDREGIRYAIVQRPFFYETKWFRLLAVAGLAMLTVGVYRRRVRQIGAELNARMEERINERMRIARDLHDTLLQSFQGLLLRFQAAHNLIPERPDEAKNALAVALERGAQAIAEARNTVQDLRESTAVTNNLARELGSVCEDLQTSDANGTSARVEVEGEARELHPILRDEIFRIASEALRNAFEHSEAGSIRVGIKYGDRELELQVSDDGKGIDPEVLQRGGRDGHWGISGMRERAESIDGRLDVWTARGTGTRIVLRIPAARAYSKFSTGRRE